jgi:hypothetical protein
LAVLDRDVGDGDAERRTLHLAELDELLHDLAREVDRDREAVAHVEAGLGGDGGVDADHLAAHVHQRAARVAGIDGRVGLDEVRDAQVGARQPIQRTALRADDARGDGERQAFAERVADGQHPLADLLLVAVAQGRRLQVVHALDLEHGDIGVGIGAHHLRAELTPVEQAHRDPVGVLDHVIVGEDVTVLRHDESGAAALLELGPATRHVEEGLEARRHPRLGLVVVLPGGLVAARCAHEHDAGPHRLGYRREGIAQILQRPGGGPEGRRLHGVSTDFPACWAEPAWGRSSSPANSRPRPNARPTRPPNFNQLSERDDIIVSLGRVSVPGKCT